MSKLRNGQKAPEFKAFNEKGESVSLSNFSGKKLILYFYPKDNTPTCTTEACNLRDNYKQLLASGFEILGVSQDSAKKHQNFIAKYKLPFSLLVDEDNQIAKAYDVWGEKTLFGKKYMGVLRTTFVIDEKGKISQIIDQVNAAEHASQIATK